MSLPVLSWLKVPPERLYSTRDQDFGGDLWARPRTLNLVRQILSAHQTDHLIFPLKVNDLSKMHAGFWLSSHPGGGHRRGREVDMWVPGFPNGKQYQDGARLGAEGANNLIRVLNALPDSVASNIEAVLVTTEGNTEFLEEVERMKNLGFKNTHLIKHYRGHINHFHVKFTEGGT